MGDPKKHRKKYSTPSHPWQKERIVEEEELRKEYGTKNKKELWKLRSVLKNFAGQAKKLTVAKGEQAEKEKENLLNKLFRLGLITENVSLDEVLGIDLRALMERRLQTLLVRKDLARTVNQARQFIVHGHVILNGKKITSPNHLVLRDEEGTIGFVQVSSLVDPEHPERRRKLKPEEVEALAKKKDAEKKKEEPRPEEKPAKEKEEKSPKKEAKPKKEKKEEPKAEKKEAEAPKEKAKSKEEKKEEKPKEEKPVEEKKEKSKAEKT